MSHEPVKSSGENLLTNNPNLQAVSQALAAAPTPQGKLPSVHFVSTSAGEDPAKEARKQEMNQKNRAFPDINLRYTANIATQIPDANFVVCAPTLQKVAVAVAEASEDGSPCKTQMDQKLFGGQGVRDTAKITYDRQKKLKARVDEANAGSTEPHLKMDAKMALAVPETMPVKPGYAAVGKLFGMEVIPFTDAQDCRTKVNKFVGCELMKPETDVDFVLATTEKIQGRWQTPFRNTEAEVRDEQGNITYPSLLMGKNVGASTCRVFDREAVVLPISGGQGSVCLIPVDNPADSKVVVARLAQEGFTAPAGITPVPRGTLLKVGACKFDCNVDYLKAHEAVLEGDYLSDPNKAKLTKVTGAEGNSLLQFNGHGTFEMGLEGFKATQELIAVSGTRSAIQPPPPPTIEIPYYVAVGMAPDSTCLFIASFADPKGTTQLSETSGR